MIKNNQSILSTVFWANATNTKSQTWNILEANGIWKYWKASNPVMILLPQKIWLLLIGVGSPLLLLNEDKQLIQLEASKAKLVNSISISSELTHLGSETSNFCWIDVYTL